MKSTGNAKTIQPPLRRWARPAFAVLALLALWPAVTPPMALFAGVAMAWACGPAFPDFARKAQKWLLQASVVGLGFGMNLLEALRSGREGMCLTVLSVAFVMGLGWLLARGLRVDRGTGYLLSAGTAICGGSAIAAVGPLVDADDRQMSVALGTVFVLNAVALFVFPPLGRALGLSQVQFGQWAAIAIHDTSSVVGAGAAYGDRALEVAALVKCTRALWILPLAAVTALLWRKRGGGFAAVPWFIFLFAAAMAANTWLPLPDSLASGLVWAAKRGFAVTLFLIGTGLGPATLASCGPRPFLMGVLLWLAIGGASLAAVLAV